ncbi:hypothetical protein ACWEBX_40955, partial [Streptomyces sp. NPDC005070]
DGEDDHELASLYAELHAFQKRLPWSREAHPGWEAEKERGRQERSGREQTDGWTDAEGAEYGRLMNEIRRVAAIVQCRPWWTLCKANGIIGPAMVDAHQALKHAPAAA